MVRELKHEAPLIVPIEYGNVDRLDATSDLDGEQCHATDPLLPVHEASGTPRRRAVALVFDILENEEDDDGDDDAREPPPLQIETHRRIACFIQRFTAVVAFAFTCGIHLMYWLSSDLSPVSFFGALLLGSFWSVAGMVLTLKRTEANRVVQKVILLAPLASLMVCPLVSMPLLALFILFLSMICYCWFPRSCETCIASTRRPRTICVPSYTGFMLLGMWLPVQLLIQFVSSLLFWLASVETEETEIPFGFELVILPVWLWFMYVRYHLFAAAKEQIFAPRAEKKRNLIVANCEEHIGPLVSPTDSEFADSV